MKDKTVQKITVLLFYFI